MIQRAIEFAIAFVLGRKGPTPAQIHKAIERGRRRRLAMARAKKSFPNDRGNYRGKRPALPECPPLSPDERFAGLKAHYLSHRMTYRNPQPTTHA